MSFLSSLLRLTLSALLILNGIGTAVAGVRMEAGHPGHGTQVGQVVTDAQAEPPCHHHHARAAAASAQMAEHGAATNVVEKSKTLRPDCCKSANCACACTFAAAGIAMSPLPPDGFSGHAAIVWTETSGHRSPSLSHLIRPPIG